MNIFCFLSNLMLVFPAVVAVRLGMNWVALCCLMAMVLSMNYHMDEGLLSSLVADVMGVVILSSVFWFLMMRVSFWRAGRIEMIGTLHGWAALYCYIKGGEDPQAPVYEEYHAAWHVFSAYMLAALIYAGSAPAHKPGKRSMIVGPVRLWRRKE